MLTPLITTTSLGLLVVIMMATCGAEAPPTFEQFSQSVTENGFEPAPTFIQYKFFRKFMENGGYSKREAAMILAHVVHETAGLTEKVEKDCDTKCATGDYKDGENEECEAIGSRASLCYCGRGYLQITGCSNYQKIGQALELGDNLVNSPTEVANKEDLSWATAFKYWQLHVHDLAEVQEGQFGASTIALYGQNVCSGGAREARNRFKKYSVIYREFGLKGQPDPSGCYGDDLRMKTEL